MHRSRTNPSTHRARPELRPTAVDAVGTALGVTFVATTAVAKSGDPAPLLALLAGAVAMFIAARLAGTLLHRAVAPALVLAVAAYVALRWGRELIGSGPLGDPFGYRNATGAFFVQVAFAGVMLAAATRRRALVVVGLLAAVASASVALRSSVAAGVTLAVAAIALPALIERRLVRPAILVAAVVFLAVLAATIALGTSYEGGAPPGGIERVLRSAVTERRVVLWHDALEVLAEHPLGVGPGRFGEVAPTALADRDARWAHNEFLQQGAELGWAGLALTIGLFLWGFARLWVHPAPDGVVALGAAALAALAIHASVDYILHFPAVPLAAAALLGSAQARTHRRSHDRRDEHGEEGLEGGPAPARMGGSSATG